MTDIRRKKDRDICQAAGLTGKRKVHPPVNPRKKKKPNGSKESLGLVIEEDEEEAFVGSNLKTPRKVVTEEDEEAFVGRNLKTPRKVVTEDVKEGSDDSDDSYSGKRIGRGFRPTRTKEGMPKGSESEGESNQGKDDSPLKCTGRGFRPKRVEVPESSDSENDPRKKNVPNDSLIKKRVGKGFRPKRTEDDLRDEVADINENDKSKKECNIDISLSAIKGKRSEVSLAKDKLAKFKRTPRKEEENSILSSPTAITSQVFRNREPVTYSTPCKHSNNIEKIDDISLVLDDEPPSNNLEEISNFFKCRTKPTPSMHNEKCDLQNEETDKMKDISSENEKSNAKSKAFDKNKLKTLVKMGKALSQSQSSQPSQQSQFSLHEMSWDDLDLELE